MGKSKSEVIKQGEAKHIYILNAAEASQQIGKDKLDLRKLFYTAYFIHNIYAIIGGLCEARDLLYKVNHSKCHGYPFSRSVNKHLLNS